MFAGMSCSRRQDQNSAGLRLRKAYLMRDEDAQGADINEEAKLQCG